MPSGNGLDGALNLLPRRRVLDLDVGCRSGTGLAQLVDNVSDSGTVVGFDADPIRALTQRWRASHHYPASPCTASAP